jgi:cysteinyl-tRNA synthetase
VLERWGADATRVFILSSHYRSPLTFTDEAMDAAQAGAERLRAAACATPTVTPAAAPATGQPPAALEGYRERFVTAMDDDLGTAQAIAVLFDLARDINRKRDAGQSMAAEQGLLRELAGVLGLTLAEAPDRAREAAPFIELLVALRSELRGAKQWALADRVRDGLAELGIELKDSPEGTTWSAK